MAEVLLSDPNVCAECASKGATCCSVRPGDGPAPGMADVGVEIGETLFPLSAIEMDRIKDIFREKGWYVSQPNTVAFTASVARLFPGEEDCIAALFPRRGYHYRLALTRTGDCVFLRKDGCMLERERRPLYCQMFPAWASGRKVTMLDADCLARHRTRGVGRFLKSLNLSPVKVRDLMARLRLAWGLSPQPGM